MQVQSKIYSRAAQYPLRKQVPRIVKHNCVPSAKSLATLEEPAQKHETFTWSLFNATLLCLAISHTVPRISVANWYNSNCIR